MQQAALGPGVDFRKPAMPPAIDELASIFDLEAIDDNYFRGHSVASERKRVFGGQVLSQALIAASRTVTDRWPHSMQGYFLRPGDPTVPILYTVERIRDGHSFTTRRVVAIQHDQAIFIMSASFQIEEAGISHQLPMPKVPKPDRLPSDEELKKRYGKVAPEHVHRYWQRRLPIEIRPVALLNYVTRMRKTPKLQLWMRAINRLPDDPVLHRATLAYACDLTLLDTALHAHGRSVFNRDIQVASLDHTMWFHRPFRADEWLLVNNESTSTGGARAFTRGTVFNEKGELVASMAQEGLVRLRDQPAGLAYAGL
jgi:acyl-CoA thioesterase-2